MTASFISSGLCLVLMSWSVCCYAGDQGIHWSSLKSSTSDHGSFSESKGLGLVTNQSVELQLPMQLNSNRNESNVPLSAVLEPSSPAGGSQQNVKTTTTAAGQAKTAAHATPTPGLVTGAKDQDAPIVQKQAIKNVSVILTTTAPSQHSKAAFDHSVHPPGFKPVTAHQSTLASSHGSQPVPTPSHHAHTVQPAHKLSAKPATALNAQRAPAPTDSPQPFLFQLFPYHLYKSAHSHDADVSPAHSNPSDSLYRAFYLGYPGVVASVGSGKAESPKSTDVRKPGKDSQTFSGSVFGQEEPMRPQVKTWSSPAVPDLTIATSSSKRLQVDLSQLGVEYKHGDEEIEAEVSQLQPDISKKASPGSKPASAHRSKPASVHRSKPASAHRSKPASAHRSKPASAHRSKPASAHRSKPASAHQSKPASAHWPKPASAQRFKLSSLRGSQPVPAPSYRAHPVQPAHKHGAKPATPLTELAATNGSQQFPSHFAPQQRSKSTLSHDAQVFPAHSNPSDSLLRASYPGFPGFAASVDSGVKSTGKGKAKRPTSIYVRKPSKDSHSSSHEEFFDSAFSHEGPMKPHIKPWSSPSVPDVMTSSASSEFVPGDLSQMRAEYDYGDEEFETEGSPPPKSSEEASHDSKPLKLSGSSIENLYVLFLKGKLPPGSITHFSSNFEHGMDHWRDSHYLRMPYADSSTQGRKRKNKSWLQKPTGIFRGFQGKMPK